MKTWFETLIGWFAGHLSPTARVLTALLPALLAVAYFVVGYAAYLVRCRVWGVPRDKEIEARGESVLVGFHFRHYFIWVTRPAWRLLIASGVPATAVTALAGILGLGAGVAVAAGRFALGGWLFLFSGILDAMDGRIARTRGEVTSAGAAIDSVLDRYVDLAMLMGLAWYYRDSWVLLPVLFAMLGTSVVPYIRAKGEGLGVAIRDGVMQRAERLLYLGSAVALSPILEAILFPQDPHPRHILAIVGVTFLAVTSNATAITRFRKLVVALGGGGVAALRRSGWVGIPALLVNGLDLAFFVLVLQRSTLTAGTGTALASAIAAVVGFVLHALRAKGRDEVWPSAGRYALVAAVALGLNAGGVAILASYAGVPALWAWLITRVVVYPLWNRPLEREYVFAQGGGLAGASRSGRAPVS